MRSSARLVERPTKNSFGHDRGVAEKSMCKVEYLQFNMFWAQTMNSNPHRKVKNYWIVDELLNRFSYVFPFHEQNREIICPGPVVAHKVKDAVVFSFAKIWLPQLIAFAVLSIASELLAAHVSWHSLFVVRQFANFNQISLEPWKRAPQLKLC